MIIDKSYAEVRRRLAAAPEKVFAAFANAGLVRRWLTPSPEIKLTVLEFDFREGGSYRFAYHIPGATTVIGAGSYSMIKPPTKLVFSWIIEPPDEHADTHFRARIRLAPRAVQGLLRTPRCIPQRHHYSVWLSLHVDPGICFRLGLRARLHAAQREFAVAWLIYATFGAVLSWSFTTLAVAAKNVMTSVPDYLVIETAFTAVQWMMVGPLTAVVFANGARKAPVSA